MRTPTKFTENRQDKPLASPQKQTRLYKFTGMPAPSDETIALDYAIVDAILARPKGSKPTTEMCAYWGRIGGKSPRHDDKTRRVQKYQQLCE